MCVETFLFFIDLHEQNRNYMYVFVPELLGRNINQEERYLLDYFYDSQPVVFLNKWPTFVPAAQSSLFLQPRPEPSAPEAKLSSPETLMRCGLL